MNIRTWLSTRLSLARISRYEWNMGGKTIGFLSYGGHEIILPDASAKEVINRLEQLLADRSLQLRSSRPDVTLANLEIGSGEQLDMHFGRTDYCGSPPPAHVKAGRIYLGTATEDYDPQSGNSYTRSLEYVGVIKKADGKFMVIRWEKSLFIPGW